MKLRPDQLSQHLSQGLQPIYIVSGDETLLVQECCDAIRAHCRKQGFVREVMHVDNQYDWNELTASASAMSLFSERQLIELRMPSGKPGDAGGKALSEYAANAPEDNVLLIVCNKLESASTRTKWYKAIESAGAAITCWPIERRDLPRWIAGRLQTAGLSADRQALELLADRVEGNLLAAVQEIEKLKLYVEGNTITEETVTAAVADNARYDVFKLVDNALAGDAAGSLKMLRGLKAEGTEAPVILWALSREVRTLYQCAEQIAQGNGLERVLQNHRVWDKRKTLVKTALKRLSVQQMAELLRTANLVDQSIKGASRRSSWELLSDLVLALSGKPLLTAAR